MAASTAWLNATLAGTAGGLTLMAFGSLHNSTGPSTTGANEISGGGYARQATAWTAPSAASMGNSAALSWPVAASVAAIGWVGEWTLVSAGVYENDIVLTSTVTFSTAGTLTAAISALTFTASDAT
jgi:hypothetical protein